MGEDRGGGSERRLSHSEARLPPPYPPPCWGRGFERTVRPRSARVIPRLYVEQPLVAGSVVAADERALHYLRNVMRRAPGDALVLFNGRDGEFEAEIAALDKRKAALKVTRLRRAQDKVPDLVLCFAPLKKDAIDFLVEKATEL